MNETIHEKIAKVVENQHGWKVGEIRIDEVERLRRGSCSFYTVGNTTLPLPYQLNYAVISGDILLSLSDDRAVSKILDACGPDAPSIWWAEIITRFHGDFGTGVVLSDDKNFGAMEMIEGAGREFVPPKFGDEGGNKTISFYMLEPEEFVVYFVKATRSKDGNVTVNTTEL